MSEYQDAFDEAEMDRRAGCYSWGLIILGTTAILTCAIGMLMLWLV